MTVDRQDESGDDRQGRVARGEGQDEQLALVAELGHEDGHRGDGGGRERQRSGIERNRILVAMTTAAAPERDIVSWDDLDRLVGILADRLAGERFDVLLAITRGGMVPAGMLAYRLRLRDILVAAVEYYDETGTPGPQPDVLPVPGRPAAARQARPRRRRGVGQRHDHPCRDRARPPGRRRAGHRGAPLQAGTVGRRRRVRMSTRSRPIAGSCTRSRPAPDPGRA